MKVFITGSTGYIGFAVARALRRAGHQVYGLVRTAEKSRMLSQNEIFAVNGNLRQPESFKEAAEACNILIHAAVDYEADTVGLDKQTVETLLTISNKGPQPKLIVFTSGVWVYGTTGWHAVDETALLVPPSIVAWRPAHEQMVLQAERTRSLVIRPGCVYGGSGSLTATWFDSASRGEPIRIAGDGQNRWAMVHLEDLADAYVKAVESNLNREIINVTDRSRFTVREMVDAVRRVTKHTGEIVSVPVAEAAKKLGGVAECLALDQHVDSRKAVRLLGWQPRHGGFVDGIEAYYEAWKAYQQ